jgi:hypothetical protein
MFHSQRSMANLVASVWLNDVFKLIAHPAKLQANSAAIDVLCRNCFARFSPNQVMPAKESAVPVSDTTRQCPRFPFPKLKLTRSETRDNLRTGCGLDPL